MIDMSDAYEERDQRAARAMEIARRLYPDIAAGDRSGAPNVVHEFCHGEFDAWTAREWRDLWVWLSSDYRTTERADRDLEELQRYVQDRYFGLRFG